MGIKYNIHMDVQTTDQLQGIKGFVKLTFTNVKTGKQEVYHILNVFCHAGKSSLARRLANAEAGYGKITYCAVGTGGSAPSVSNVTISTELFRKLISVVSYNSNVVTFTTFYNTSEANGVLTNIGLFGDDATATLNTGTLYAQTTIVKTKTTSDTLTIEWSLILN